MNRLSVFLLCLGAFLLSGCPRHAALPQAVGQPLTPTYTEILPKSTDFLEFSENGGTFIVAGKHNLVRLYNTETFEKRVTIQKSNENHRLYIQGVGYIDDNTWYVATDYSYLTAEYWKSLSANIRQDYLKEISISIRQIEPPREIYKHDLGAFSHGPVFANKTHIAQGEKLLNWHDGSVYDALITNVGLIHYILTPDSQVVSSSGLARHVYLFHDPVKQEGMDWNIGSGDLTLSPDARYAVVSSYRGKCELWQLPQKEQVGNCRRGWLLESKKWRKVAFRRDSSAFAIAAENEAFVYATAPFQNVMAVTMPKAIQALALSEDLLAAADASGTIRVWHVTENKLLGEYASDSQSLTSHVMGFQPGGGKLAVSQGDQLMVFDLDAVSQKNTSP